MSDTEESSSDVLTSDSYSPAGQFLAPKIKLFLSVDLLGSTKLKHDEDALAPNVSDRLVPSDVESGYPGSARWFRALTEFYDGFQLDFQNSWRKTRRSDAIDNEWERFLAPVNCPKLWKMNGDELLFVSQIDHPSQLLVALLAWRSAVWSYRRKLKNRGEKLDLKATAWMAGFPVANHEIAFDRLADGADDKPSEAEGGQYYRLQRLYARQELAREVDAEKSDVVLDYVGPSIDTGFRLAGLASPRIFPISAEIAYFLAQTSMFLPLWDDLRIRSLGRRELKGVLGGLPYPVFWIDAADPKDELVAAEDQVTPQPPTIKAESVRCFLDKFFRDKSNFLFPPFIWEQDSGRFSELPQQYRARLSQLQDWANQELRRYRQRSESGRARSSSEDSRSQDDSADENATKGALDLEKVLDYLAGLRQNRPQRPADVDMPEDRPEPQRTDAKPRRSISIPSALDRLKR